MNCSETQNALLSSIPAELSAEEHAAIRAHLAHCPTCRRELDAYQQLDQLLYNRLAATPVRGMERAKATLASRRNHWWTHMASQTSALSNWGRVTLMPAGVSLATLGLLLLLVTVLRPSWVGQDENPVFTMPIKATGEDRMWVESVSPAAGVSIEGQTPVEVRLGYKLVSAPEAALSLKLADVPANRTRYFTQPITVQTGEGQAVVRFTLDAARARAMFGPGPVQFEATLRAWDGRGDPVLLVNEVFGETQFVVR